MDILSPSALAVDPDDFQVIEVLGKHGDTYRAKFTLYPNRTQTICEDRDWRHVDKRASRFLSPTPTENYDSALAAVILDDLKTDGIDLAGLTDKGVVEAVVPWALKRADYVNTFSVWTYSFEDGKPKVRPELSSMVERICKAYHVNQDQLIETEVLGRSMYYARKRGSCTSASVYVSTILRAIGIPTRMVICVPILDPNSENQWRTFKEGIANSEIKEAVTRAIGHTRGFCNHVFNEVYIGHRWIRLNYERLGQPILDEKYLGLIVHIATTGGLSETGFADSWGDRYFLPAYRTGEFDSVNPYKLISITEQMGKDESIHSQARLESATSLISSRESQ